MDTFVEYLKVFAVGGILCAIGQLLIDKTKLTPARILTAYVVAGVILGAVGLYQPLADWAGAGASVPLTGFGKGRPVGSIYRWLYCLGSRYLCGGIFRNYCCAFI